MQTAQGTIAVFRAVKRMEIGKSPELRSGANAQKCLLKNS